MLSRPLMRIGWFAATLTPAAALAQSGYLDAKPETAMGGLVMMASSRFDEFRMKTLAILGQAGNAAGEWQAAIGRLLTPMEGSPSPGLTILFAVIVAIGMACCGHGVRFLLERRDRGGHSRLVTALLRLSYDGLGLVTGFALSVLATSTLFTRRTPDAQFAASLLWAVIIWACISVATHVMTRPDDRSIRLIPIECPVARRLWVLVAIAAAIAVLNSKLIYVFLAHGLPIAVAQFTALVVGAVVTLLLLAALILVVRNLRRHRAWLFPVGLAVLGTGLLAWFGAVILLDFTIFNAVVMSGIVAWLVLALDRLLGLALPEQASNFLDPAPAAPLRRVVIIRAIQRSLLAVAGLITLIVLGRIWAVEVLPIFSPERWRVIARALTTGLGIAVAGYVLYQTLKAWIAVPPPPSFGASDSEAHPQSRLATVLPILTAALLAASIAIAVLVALSELGVNTAPLLAGAGIFGLALSFGSQALVRDIVSGIFYMADDAFRVGEYIETGRLKGTVEKIMVRSVRLRHQNGQIHTIPYGQLGAVTNYSRDWSTLKFNLRLARHVDLELVRKTAKKVGEQLEADPEFAGEFLEPLKLQGVADVVENAIICRFKLTVRPSKPSEIQREALKRLYNAFGEKGIAFAAHAVTVRSEDGTVLGTASGGAASQIAEIVAQTAERQAVQTAT